MTLSLKQLRKELSSSLQDYWEYTKTLGRALPLINPRDMFRNNRAELGFWLIFSIPMAFILPYTALGLIALALASTLGKELSSIAGDIVAEHRLKNNARLRDVIRGVQDAHEIDEIKKDNRKMADATILHITKVGFFGAFITGVALVPPFSIAGAIVAATFVGLYALWGGDMATRKRILAETISESSYDATKAVSTRLKPVEITRAPEGKKKKAPTAQPATTNEVERIKRLAKNDQTGRPPRP